MSANLEPTIKEALAMLDQQILNDRETVRLVMKYTLELTFKLAVERLIPDYN
jgi:hypothetical protein